MFEIKDEFTGFEYMLIHLANTYGEDKKSFEERIHWAKWAMKESNLAELVQVADEPFLFKQAWREIDKVLQGESTGLICYLDATNSFLQIFAALSGCVQSAYACNMVDASQRVDAYGILSDIVNEAMPHLKFTRQQAKDLFMKSLAYGSEQIPKELFPDEDDYATYLKLMNQYFPGVMYTRNKLMGMWDSTAYHHTWTLPDGHTAHVPVEVQHTDYDDIRIEVPEVKPYNDGKVKSIAFIHSTNEPSKRSTPILANVIQSLDAWLVRQVITSCAAHNIHISTIHDAFGVHANHVGFVRHTYRRHLSNLAASDYLVKLTKELTGETVKSFKLSQNLPELILNSRYMLS